MTAARSIPKLAEAPRDVTSLTTKSGAAAELHRSESQEVLRVCDPQGAILFEYDAAAGRGTLRMPAGDLQLEAPLGNIQLVAGKGVQCVAAGEISLRSATATSVTTTRPDGPLSGIRVAGDHVAVASERVVVSSQQAELRVERTSYVGRRLSMKVEQVEQWVGKLETAADTIVERAANVFRQVSHLHQLRAGRLRTIVEGTMQWRGQRVVVDAREDVHIDGKKINLG